jgi:inner membrane protein
MTGLTHQMVALLAALWLLTLYPISLGPVLATAAVIAVMVGALTPDLDQPTANLWRRLLGARLVGNVFQAFSGGHRHMTHSLLGIAAIGLATRWVVGHMIHPDYVPAAGAIWVAFMVGYISHPIADTLTDLGVPWFWPLRFHVRIPPGPHAVRVTTGSLVEQFIVRGGIIITALILLQSHWLTLKYFFQ